MLAALEQTDTRFQIVFGSSRGGGLSRSNSILPRPGRDGILDVLYAQLRHDGNWPRARAWESRKYVVICRDRRRRDLYIANMTDTRRDAIDAIDGLDINGVDNYVVSLEEAEGVCVHPVELNQTRHGPIRDFNGTALSLTALLARA